ncbi:MAG: U32 family peptidase C-terminal domain-containing protein [Nitrospinae bacterium]|nr:U32 family peptidase C-terminal domain-containing protein [Nitrospinota bacterium]
MVKIPELLSPAGSPEKLRYALAYGADAVYAGIPRFSLRARDNPYNDHSLKEDIEYCRRKGKKIYITANILPQNRKLESFKKSLAGFAEAQPDGIIMSDPGMIQFVLNEFPQVPVHLSVQTNTINWMSVAFWRDQGVKRIILSRELSLQEFQEIHERVPEMELEAFVHGSICIAYSGRCLLSNYFNHRDANQGTCTNSCRWEYNLYQELPGGEGGPQKLQGDFFIEEASRNGELMPIDEDEHGTYIMNSKDLRAIEHLDALRRSGVESFKIEGRSKSIYYLSLITQAYRQAIDDMAANRPFDPTLLDATHKTANRGFTTAFLLSASQRATERFDSPQEQNQPQIYAGKVVNDRPGGWMEVEVKNRIALDQEMECISPQNKYRFRITSMENANGMALATAHGGNDTVWVKTDGPIEPYALLSRIVETPVSSPASVLYPSGTSPSKMAFGPNRD